MTATTRRDLRTGRSTWEGDFGHGVPYGALDRSIAVDVAIVGGGITGALLAHALAPELDVAVLDRRPPLSGSTLASTALLLWEVDSTLTELGARIGEQAATRAYRRSWRSVHALTRVVREERLRCGFREQRSLYLAGTEHGHRALQKEVAARQEAGLPSRYLDASTLRRDFGIDRTGAIVSDDCASADPVALAAGLLRRASSRGTRVYSPVEVEDAHADPRGVSLTTRGGPVVRARHAAFCCGYEFPKVVPTPGASVVSSWVLASAPGQAAPSWLRDTVVWEASDPYLYLRTTPDGRVIVGGEDEASASAHEDPATLREKTRIIEEKVHALLPDVDLDVRDRWAGAFGESATGLPLITEVPGLPHAWSVIGLGGNGITWSVIAAQIVAAAIRGVPDPDADLFDLPGSTAARGE